MVKKSDLALFSFKGDAPNEPTFKEREIDLFSKFCSHGQELPLIFVPLGVFGPFWTRALQNKVFVKRGSNNTSHSRNILIFNPDNMLAVKIQGVFLSDPSPIIGNACQ